MARATNRPSDTAALVQRPYAPGQSHSISSRKIDNGYIVDQSTYDPNTQQYKCSETFVRNPPRLVAPRMDGRQGGGKAPGAVGDEGRGGAKALLGKDV